MRTCQRNHVAIAFESDDCPVCAMREAFQDEAQKMEVLDRNLREIGERISNYLVRDPLVMAVKIKRSKKP
jgi:hypothetical protein